MKRSIKKPLPTSIVIDPTLIDTFVFFWNQRNKDNPLRQEYINWGWCYQFAVVIQKIYGGDIISSASHDHVWVRINNKDFDSDYREGTIFSDHGDSKVVSFRELSNIWRDHGKSGPIQRSVISKVVASYLQQQQEIKAA